jgi:hypothetical protein
MAVNFTRAVLSTDVTGAPLRVHLGAGKRLAKRAFSNLKKMPGVFPDQASSTLALLSEYPRLAALFAPPPVSS